MKAKLTEEDLINWWLERYHNTNLKEVQALHPDWRSDNPEYSPWMFYDAYPCTQAQHDEWLVWAKEKFAKHFRLTKKQVDRHFALTYLNVSPKVIE